MELQVESLVRASRDTVFSYLTDSAKYALWQGNKAELDPRPGGIYRVEMPAGIVSGKYVEVEPPARVVFTWGWENNAELPSGSTTVEVTLVEAGDDTIVRLRHFGFEDSAMRDKHAEGWSNYTQRLTVAASGGHPPPDSLS